MKIKTYADLKEHLLATMDSFTDQMCEANSGITKEYVWNTCMNACLKHPNQEDAVADIIIANVLREFPEYTRCDYVFKNVDDSGTPSDLPL